MSLDFAWPEILMDQEAIVERQISAAAVAQGVGQELVADLVLASV